MPDLGNWAALEPEVFQGMHQLANININTMMIELGCGDGRNLELALAYGVKPAKVWGVEIDTDLYNVALGKGLNVINDDCFNLNYSGYGLVVYWFNMGVDLPLLMAKLYSEMASNAKVVCLHGTRHQWRDGVYVAEESCYDVNTGVGVLPYPSWVPTAQGEVLGNRFYLYVR